MNCSPHKGELITESYIWTGQVWSLLSDTGGCWDHRQTQHSQFYLVFAARAADTVAAAPLTTAALYLAGGKKAEKVPEPSTVLVELLTLIGKERQRKRTRSKKTQQNKHKSAPTLEQC